MRKLILLIFLFPLLTLATLSDVDKAFIPGKNLLSNPGFENGKANIAATDLTDISVVSSGSNLLIGRNSITWNSDGAAQYLRHSITIPYGVGGTNGVGSCLIMTPSGTATHTIDVYDGSNILATENVISSTTPVRMSVNFIFPAGNSTLYLRILSVAADEPSITIDDCYLGAADGFNIGSVGQASFIGSAYIAGTTNCSAWTRTNTALGAVASDVDCPGPTVETNPGPGVIQTTDADLPRFTVNGLPPGYYEVLISHGGLNSSASNVNYYAINDGTTTSVATVGESGGTNQQAVTRGYFSYTTAGNRTFELYTGSSAGTVTINNNITSRNIYFSIKRYPLSQEQVFTASQLANSWSGYHDNTCSWARTDAAYGDPATDASCGLSERTNSNFGTVTGANSLPSITFTPKKAGRYFICSSASVVGATSGADIAMRLWDGTNVIAELDWDDPAANIQIPTKICGIVVASSVTAKTISLQTKASTGSVTIQALTASSSVEWSIFQIDQNFPQPKIAYGVETTSTGVTGIESAEFNCDAGSAITSQHGSWVSSVGNIASGACTVTLTAGTFSSTPYCQASLVNVANPDGVLGVDPTSSTSVTVDCDDAGSATDCTSYDFTLMCQGAR